MTGGLCIAGNKIDAEDHMQVTGDDLKMLSYSIGCEYVLTSAWKKKGIEVDQLYIKGGFPESCQIHGQKLRV